MPITGIVILVLALLALGAGVSFAKTGRLTVSPGIPYDAFFSHFAILYGVPKRLMVAVVAQESGFNPKAVNTEESADKRLGRNVDSLGLCQILFPDTARHYNPGITRDDCLDPETNLDIGFRVMRDVLARYPGGPFPAEAVSAYNAGRSLRRPDGTFGNESHVNAVRKKWERYANV